MPDTMLTLTDQRRLLATTSHVILDQIAALPADLVAASDGRGRWTVHEILAHLVDVEESERGWMPRIRHIVDGQPGDLPRVHGDRHMTAYAVHPTAELQARFARARDANLVRLDDMISNGSDLERRGRHPDLGPVSASQLLAAWSLHNLDHLTQIVRIIGTQRSGSVGPIAAFLPICAPATPR